MTCEWIHAVIVKRNWSGKAILLAILSLMMWLSCHGTSLTWYGSTRTCRTTLCLLLLERWSGSWGGLLTAWRLTSRKYIPHTDMPPLTNPWQNSKDIELPSVLACKANQVGHQDVGAVRVQTLGMLATCKYTQARSRGSRRMYMSKCGLYQPKVQEISVRLSHRHGLGVGSPHVLLN